MRKIFLWGGLGGFIVFVAFGGLAGATNNGKALLPGIYGTNSVIWLFFAVIAFILFIIGLVMTIVHAIKNRQSNQIK